MRKTITLMTTSLVVLSGCSRYQEAPSEEKKLILNINDDFLKRTLVVNKTTSADIEKKFGTPDLRSTKNSDLKRYFYSAVESKEKSQFVPFVSKASYKTKTVTLVVEFKNNVVSSYDVISKETEIDP